MSWFSRKGSSWGPSEGDSESPTRWGLTTVISTILDVVPGGVIRAGKESYDDTTHTGFWLGTDSDGLGKFHVGSSSFYMRWTGTKLEICGSLTTKNGYVQVIDDSEETYGEGVTLLQGAWLTSGALRWKSSAGYVGAIATAVNNATAGSSLVLYTYPRVTGSGNTAGITLACYNKALGEAGATAYTITLNSNGNAKITGELEITGNTANDVQILLWCPADQAVDIIQVMDTDETQKLALDKDGNLDIAGAYQVDGTQVVGARQAAIADVTETGTAEDGTARAAINDILAALRSHGLIAG